MEYGLVARGAAVDLRSVTSIWTHLDRLSTDEGTRLRVIYLAKRVFYHLEGEDAPQVPMDPLVFMLASRSMMALLGSIPLAVIQTSQATLDGTWVVSAFSYSSFTFLASLYLILTLSSSNSTYFVGA